MHERKTVEMRAFGGITRLSGMGVLIKLTIKIKQNVF